MMKSETPETADNELIMIQNNKEESGRYGYGRGQKMLTENDTKRILTQDDVINEVRPCIQNMSQRDLNLYNETICKVGEESKKLAMKDIMLTIHFQDRPAIQIKTVENPKNRYYVSYNGNWGIQTGFDRESYPRIAFRTVTGTIDGFCNALHQLIRILGAAAMLAITGNSYLTSRC